jgi:hypothetical protein
MAIISTKSHILNRSNLAHLIRAASRILKNERMLVIGSQSILASFDDEDLPEMLTMSMEADVAFFEDPENEKADIAEAILGELSMFHHTFGYYLQGVSMETAVLPKGWEMRLRRFVYGDYGGADARCLEVHDLAIAKLVANRSKDRDFVRALMAQYIALEGILVERALELHESQELVDRVISSIRALRPAA